MDRWDWLFVGGLAVAGVGLWMLHPSAALCVIGAALSIIAWRRAPARALANHQGGG